MAVFGQPPIKLDSSCYPLGLAILQLGRPALRESLFFRDTVSPLVIAFEDFTRKGRDEIRQEVGPSVLTLSPLLSHKAYT
jgi:hypothetical protein